MEYPFSFTYGGQTYKQKNATEYVVITEDGEKPISKKSNDLMDALLGGEIIDEK